MPIDELIIKTVDKDYVVTEQLVRDMDCPPPLWMRAVFVFFYFHQAFTNFESFDLTLHFNNFKYADVTWGQIHQKVVTEAKMASALLSDKQLAGLVEDAGPKTTSFDFELGYNGVLEPLVGLRSRTGAGALYSGLVGQFGEIHILSLKFRKL